MNIVHQIKNIFNKTNINKITHNPFSDIINSSIFNISPQYKQKFNEIYNQNKQSFDQMASPDIKLEEQDIIPAQITIQSYIDNNNRTKQIGSFVLDQKNSTHNSCIYYDDKQKICIIGYRGTVITDIKDITSDAQIILDIQGIDPRVKNALFTYDNIKRQYQGFKIQVCGHSLGGTLSYIVAKHRNPDRCTVFNPGASLNTLFIQMLKDTYTDSQRTKNTYTYKILGDIISTLAFVGHTKVFRIGTKDPLSLHAIANFQQNLVNT